MGSGEFTSNIDAGHPGGNVLETLDQGSDDAQRGRKRRGGAGMIEAIADLWKSLSRNRRRALVASLACTAMLCIGLWLFVFRPPSADDVAQMTADALSNRDVNTLLSLTSEDERQKLHLTRDNVRAFLTETLYAHGKPGDLTARRVQEYPVDQLLYHIVPEKGRLLGLRDHLAIMVTQSEDRSWHLALAYLLLNVSGLDLQVQAPMDTINHFRALAQRHGIKGVRLNTGGYEYMAEGQR
jgi:hypothetical protein